MEILSAEIYGHSVTFGHSCFPSITCKHALGNANHVQLSLNELEYVLASRIGVRTE